MKKVMFGFAGEIASGKGTGTGFLKEWYPGTPSVRFSDSLREYLAWFNNVKAAGIFGALDFEGTKQYLTKGLYNIFPTDVLDRSSAPQFAGFTAWVQNGWLSYQSEVKADRTNLQGLSTALRAIFAENILEQTVITRIRSAETESPLAIIEGIRRVVDIGTLLATQEFRLVYVEIDPVVAHQRMVKRNENVGDAEMSFERFMELRNAEAEQQIRLLKPHAHLVIDNSGPLEVFEGALRAKAAEWAVS